MLIVSWNWRKCLIVLFIVWFYLRVLMILVKLLFIRIMVDVFFVILVLVIFIEKLILVVFSVGVLFVLLLVMVMMLFIFFRCLIRICLFLGLEWVRMCSCGMILFCLNLFRLWKMGFFMIILFGCRILYFLVIVWVVNLLFLVIMWIVILVFW